MVELVERVSMIGLGKLGLPCASVMSKSALVKGYDPIYLEDHETHKSEWLLGKSDFEISDSIASCIDSSQWIFIAVPTPHDKEYGGETPTSHLEPKDFDYTIVKEVLQEIAETRTPEQRVVLISTVLPGTIRRELAPIIPDLIYNPYLIAIGTVESDFSNPEMLIIGTDHGQHKDSWALQDFYTRMLKKHIRSEIGTWEEAESIKIFYNTFISMKISFANMIMDVSEKLGYMNVDKVTTALSKSTKRIMSSMYMTPGMGDAGACHPRDNIALRWLAKELDLGYDMFGTVMEIREKQAENIAKKLCSYGMPVVIVGTSYKPNIPNTDGSYSFLIGHYVEKIQGEVQYIDPLNDLTASGDGPFVYFISYHHDYILEEYKKFVPGSVVVDPWRKRFEADTRYDIGPHYFLGESHSL